MPDTDPTPTTPVTLGDRLAWFRGDMVAQLEALGVKVDAVATAIADLRGTGPENTLRSINQSIWNLAGPAPGTTLTDLATAIQAAQSGGATEATAQAILAAIGTLASYPANYTVKELLALLNTNISAEPGTGNLNADPGACGAAAWDYNSRTGAMTKLGTSTIGGIDYDIYAPQVPFVPGFLENYGQVADCVATIPAEFATTYPYDSVNVCVSWDFTGAAYTPAVCSVMGVAVSGPIWPTGITLGDVTILTGLNTVTLFPTGEIVSYRIAVPSGEVVLPNMFWHVIHNVYTGS